MEKEVEAGKIYSLEINIDSLNFIKSIIEGNNSYLVGELEIDPFNKFSLEFSSEYWYLKYHLLRDGKILLDEDDFSLFEEYNINVIFFELSDFNSFLIKCNDGKWYLEINKLNEVSVKVYEKLKDKIIW